MQQPASTKPPTTPQPYVVSVGDLPRTPNELRVLYLRRSELFDQLSSANSRRKKLADQLRRADPSARPGIETQVGVLDARILRLEQQVDRTNDLIANAPAAALANTTLPLPPPARAINVGDIATGLVPIVAILSVFVLGPFAIAMSRYVWKRAAAAPARAAVTDPAVQNRLEQLQQSVDSIAIEVERIAEGQRFVTKLMSERERVAVGSGREGGA